MIIILIIVIVTIMQDRGGRGRVRSSSRTEHLDFRGFDSRRYYMYMYIYIYIYMFLTLRGGIPRSTGRSPGIQTWRFSVCGLSLCGLAVHFRAPIYPFLLLLLPPPPPPPPTTGTTTTTITTTTTTTTTTYFYYYYYYCCYFFFFFFLSFTASGARAERLCGAEYRLSQELSPFERNDD